jgi:hypothetical protein
MIDPTEPEAGEHATAKTAVVWILKIIAAACSLFMLGWAWLFAEGHREWQMVSVIAGMGVVIATMALRLRWMVLVLLASVALSMTSCSYTFHWG